MRQETGSNNSAAIQKVSIRLASGGHSFSVDMLPKRAFDSDAETVFEVITHKCTLVPAEVFEPAAAAAYLAADGRACSADERAVFRIEGDKAVVMAAADSCVAQIDDKFGGRAVLTSPLLREYEAKGRELHICTLGGVSFFKLYDGPKLQYAEAAATADSDEVLYYTTLLDREFALGEYLIYISGDEARKTAKLLKRYYRKVLCE